MLNVTSVKRVSRVKLNDEVSSKSHAERFSTRSTVRSRFALERVAEESGPLNSSIVVYVILANSASSSDIVSRMRCFTYVYIDI